MAIGRWRWPSGSRARKRPERGESEASERAGLRLAQSCSPEHYQCLNHPLLLRPRRRPKVWPWTAASLSSRLKTRQSGTCSPHCWVLCKRRRVPLPAGGRRLHRGPQAPTRWYRGAGTANCWFARHALPTPQRGRAGSPFLESLYASLREQLVERGDLGARSAPRTVGEHDPLLGARERNEETRRRLHLII